MGRQVDRLWTISGGFRDLVTVSLRIEVGSFQAPESKDAFQDRDPAKHDAAGQIRDRYSQHGCTEEFN